MKIERVPCPYCHQPMKARLHKSRTGLYRAQCICLLCGAKAPISRPHADNPVGALKEAVSCAKALNRKELCHD